MNLILGRILNFRCVKFVFRAIKKNSCRHTSLYEAMLPVFSTLVLFSFSVVWALNSPTDVLELDPRAFYWAMGTVFSNIAVKN